MRREPDRMEAKTVRRASVLIILCLLLLGGAVASLWLVPAAPLPRMGRLPGNLAAALAGFLLAALVACIGLLLLSSSLRRVACLVEQHAKVGSLMTLPLQHPDIDRLIRAANQNRALAAERIQQAEAKARELEIRLKIAEAARQHLEAIIFSINDAVLVTDAFDELVLANDSAARTFHFDLGAASRTPLASILSDARMVGLMREMRASDSRSGRRIVEHELEGKTFKVTLCCLAPKQDRVGGVVAVLHDMTREREVAQMKNDFVSHVSHELRTPLASIKAYIEMLIDGEAQDEKTQREFYDVIHNEANRLSRLIDDILNISRIESGLVKINKVPVSLPILLKEAVDVIAPQARQKNITVVENLSPAFYQTLADRDMLYEAILNLLGNAVKYTPEGGKITISAEIDEQLRRVRAKIVDTGSGIPAKDLPFVFDKFYRSEANSRMAKGTGLGLSLVKRVIEAVHQGRVFVESEVGKGSTFGFELDLMD